MFCKKVESAELAESDCISVQGVSRYWEGDVTGNVVHKRAGQPK
jgi:hypothetical protein